MRARNSKYVSIRSSTAFVRASELLTQLGYPREQGANKYILK